MSIRPTRRSLLFALLLAAVPAAFSAEEERAPGKALPVSVYEQLQAVQKRLDSDETARAIAQLETLSARVANDGFSYGIVQQYLVGAFMQAGDPQRARAAAESTLARTDLEDDARQQLTYSAGKLALMDEDFTTAAKRLREWLQREPHPTGEVFYLLGYASYRLGDPADAETQLENAVTLGPASDGWYELLLAVLLEQDKKAAAARLLAQRIGTQPERTEHWKRLASVHLSSGRDEEGLAALMLARRSGLLTTDAELEQLLRLHRHVGVPERAARLLAQWLEEGALARNPERLMTLAELWLEARERSAAKIALANAADGAANGRAADLLGRLEFEDENWSAAAAALHKARQAGGINAPEQSTLLLGIAAMRSGQAPLARRALEEAAARPATGKQARFWLDQL